MPWCTCWLYVHHRGNWCGEEGGKKLIFGYFLLELLLCIYICSELSEESDLGFHSWSYSTNTVQVEEIWLILLVVYLVRSL